MALNPFDSSIPRDANEKFGESVSILDFAGGRADNVTDNSPAMNAALESVRSKGGRAVYLPGAYYSYRFNNPVELATNMRGITIYGDGPYATRIRRGADLPDGKGIFTLNGARDIGFEGLAIDGNVTSAVGKLYHQDEANGGFSNDPMSPALTKNTSFWVKGGSQRIWFRNVRIEHTGGYAILLDGTSDYIDDISIDDIWLEYNRPHFFGVDAGDMNYGSWTGGILYTRGNSTGYPVRGLKCRNVRAKRVMGNVIWGHLYNFNRLHSDIRVTDSSFIDCGLDGILFGGCIGGVAANNTFRRIGFISNSDSGALTPKFLPGLNATALDTSGLVKGVNYKSNTFININGGHMDLDGYCYGVVSGNSCRMAKSGDIDYVEDQVASFGTGSGPLVYGVQPSNSQNNEAGEGIVIDGNLFVNMRRGAICLAATRGSSIRNNLIHHPADAIFAPIVLFNIGAADTQRTYDNVIESNEIHWNPASQAAAVQELGDALGYLPFDSNDQNLIGENQLFGNAFEFYKDPDTKSTTGRIFPTSSTVSAANRSTIERTGDAAPKTSIVTDAGGSSQDLVSFHDARFMDLNGRDDDPPAPDTGRGAVYFNKDEEEWRQYDHTAASWVPLGGDSFWAEVGTNAAIYYKAGPVVIGNDVEDGSDADLQIHGFANASVGFSTQGTSYDAIQAPDGGAYAKWLIARTSVTWMSDTAVNAGLSSSNQARLYFDSSLNLLQASQHGAQYYDVLVSDSMLVDGTIPFTIVRGRVTASNQFVYKGGVLGVGTNTPAPGLAAHFVGGVYSSGAFNSGASGIAFKTNNDFWSVDSSGNMSGAGESNFLLGYKVNGILFARYVSSKVELLTDYIYAEIFNSTATGTNIAYQAGGGNYQVNAAGSVSGAGQANFVNGYIGGSFRGSGVAVESAGVGGGSFAVYNGSSYLTFAQPVTGGVIVSAHVVNGTTLQQNGTPISSLFAAIGHNHTGVYQPIEPPGNPYMKAGDVVAAFVSRRLSQTVLDGGGNPITLQYTGW